jgi:hypothetical protein
MKAWKWLWVALPLAAALAWWPKGVPGRGPMAAAAEAQPAMPRVAFRILFGLRDTQPMSWDGSIAVTPGAVEEIKIWRPPQPPDPQQPDTVTGSAWTARTRRQQLQGAAAQRTPLDQRPMADNGVLVTLRAPRDAQLSVTTKQGDFNFSLAAVPYHETRRFLDGAVAVERVPAVERLTGVDTEDDFPAAAVAPDGTLWVAYVAYRCGLDPRSAYQLRQDPDDLSFLVKPGGGDQIRVLRSEGGRWSAPMDVTPPGGDVYKPAVAVDGSGAVWVVWSEQKRDNWDLFARAFRGGQWSKTERLTTDAGADVTPVVAVDRAGKLWLAWQGIREREASAGANSEVLLKSFDGRRWSGEVRVSVSAADDWEPALAVDSRGDVFVAWDTYDKGDFDVWLHRVTDEEWRAAPRMGRLDARNSLPVAASLRYEARAALAVDRQDRVWIAYEDADERWSKDSGFLVPGGTRIYAQGRWVKVACLDGNVLKRPAQQPFEGLPPAERNFKAFPRLTVDGSGALWLVARHRQTNMRYPVGTVWFAMATRYDGDHWTRPVFIPESDGLLDNRPAMVRAASGDPALIYNTDARQHREAGFVTNDLCAAYLATDASPAREAQLVPSSVEKTSPETITASERADVQRLRDYRVTAGAVTYRILRGEFHRHTDVSPDGQGDGTLTDMYRYALDAASMDWLGCGDHDNGNGREYTWWLTQKLADIYEVGTRFMPMYSYERSNAYPDGHRNVIWDKRGIRTLARLPVQSPANGRPGDTKMLYRALHRYGGITSAHTVATDQGTDWRDNDPEVEPVVEIYQGARQSYEYYGAPKTAKGVEDSVSGFQKAGYVSEALKKGYRLGFQSSSDHGATHLSYTMCLVEKPTRTAILDSLKKRHCYAATDNILVDVRGGSHVMGDEFDTSASPRLDVSVVGTGPISRVDVIKDNQIVYTREPRAKTATFTYTDNTAEAGKTSYYYVRVLQEDQQMAWVSPMWIRYRPR